VFVRPEADERLVELFARIGTGESMPKAVAAGLLSTPLTRRMCHLYLQTPPGWDAVRAVRRAQALAYEATVTRANAIARSRLGHRLREDEPFWQTVIQWFVDRPALGDGQLDPVLDYLEEMRARDPAYELTGRPLPAVLRAMHAWIAELHGERRGPDADIPSSGYPDATWSERTPTGLIMWSMRELRSMADIHTEGKTQRHCVYAYASKARAGVISLWSMGALHPDGRVVPLTVEVDHRAQAVVQVRGVDNRLPTGAELAAVKAWAARVGIGSVSEGG